MEIHKESSKEGQKNDLGLEKEPFSAGLKALELFSLLQGSTEDSCSFSRHRKPACVGGQNHVTCNKLPGAGDTEHLGDELHAHLARWKQTHRVRALPPAGLVLRGCSYHWRE